MDSPWLAALSDYANALIESNTLLYGAAFIGLLEGFVVARVFRASVWRSLLAMLAANYVSMFAGVSLRHLVVPHLAFLTLDRTLVSLAVIGAGFFVLAVLVEWPFLLWPLQKHRARAWQAFKGSLLAQLSSSLLLAGLYWTTSDFSLLVRTKQSADFSFCKSPAATVYYVALDDGHLWRRTLDGSPAELVQKLPRRRADAFLYAAPTPEKRTVDLWLSATRKEGTPLLVKAEFAQNATLLPRLRPGKEKPGGLPFETDQPARLRDHRGAQDWIVSLAHEHGEKFRARNATTNEAFELGMETPFFSWHATHAALLADNQAIVEFGPQLLLLDLDTRRVAVVARGTGPCVVFDPAAAAKP